MKQDYRGNFRVNMRWFLPFSPVSSTELCSFWNGWKDLFTLHKLGDKQKKGHGSSRLVMGRSEANELINFIKDSRVCC